VRRVEPFGRAGERVRISTAGGRSPRWRGDGRELFFRDPEGRLTGASLLVANTIVVRATERLATAVRAVEEFDASSDGQRFVVILSIPI
jgi:dipeptidyl aminopeptidase/acylaminoacyl peptidase